MNEFSSTEAKGFKFRVAYAAYMDAGPKFELQAFYWCKSLLDSNTAALPSDIFLFVPDVSNSPAWVRHAKINLIEANYFDDRHKYCNKISMWSDPYIFIGYDVVVFNDCDLFYLSNHLLDFDHDFIAGTVDFPNPKWEIVKDTFHEANLPVGKPTSARWEKRRFCGLAARGKTAATNLNGGFYAARVHVLKELGQAWGKWAIWCLDNDAIASRLGIHVDQIAMALALTELSIDVGPLPDRCNVPTHLGNMCRTPTEEPVVLHYHDSLNDQALIRRSGSKRIDGAIAKANRWIDHWKQTDFNNRVFWNARYVLHPEKGSGIGSRGDTLKYKRSLLRRLVKNFETTIDLGCGDLETSRGLPYSHYIGVDVSEVALKISREKEPGWQFISFDEFIASGMTADLVLCFDVLIHQPTEDEYKSLLALLVQSAREMAVISAYQAPPTHPSALTFYHEPILDTLSTFPDIADVALVGQYHEVGVYAVAKKSWQTSLTELVKE